MPHRCAVGGGTLIPRPEAEEAKEEVEESLCPIALLPIREAGLELLSHTWWNEKVAVTTIQHQRCSSRRDF